MGKAIVVSFILCASTLLPFETASAAPTCTPTSVTSAGVRTLTFTNSTACTWTVPTNLTLASTILIVGGGGGGGYYGNAGGGGAGALVVTTNFALTPGDTFDITAGTGGAGSTAGAGTNGTPSSFGVVTAVGGGGGAGGDGTNGVAVNNGKVGGSGGGGSSYNGALTGQGGTSNATIGISSPWSAFGNSGGNGSGGVGAGGGGAGGAGGAVVRTTGGIGKDYFGATYAKGGNASAVSNTPVTGSGNGGNCFSGGGTGSSGSIVIQYTVPKPVFTYSAASQSTLTGVAFSTNAITSTGTPISSYAITPTLPTGVTLNSGTGQLIGAPSVLLSSTLFTITATDNTGETGTAGLTLSVTAGPASISTSIAGATIYKGISVNIIATVNTSGKVRFFANQKRIPNCLSIATVTSGSITATCSWKPPVQGLIRITASVTPSSATYLAGSSSIFLANVRKRDNTR